MRASDSFLLTKMAAVQASMYKLPVFYNETSPVELSNCMYSMESYHKHDDEQVSPV